MIRKWTLLIIAAHLLAIWPFSGTATGQDFFKEKTIRLIAGFPPGGGVDTDARLIARHIGRHIPGNPNVLVVNMPGAGGRIALTHVHRIAKRDGLTWILVPVTAPMLQIMDKDRSGPRI